MKIFGLKSLLHLSLCLLFVVVGCRPKKTGSESNTQAAAACDGLFGKAYNDCVAQSMGSGSVASSLESSLTGVGTMMLQNRIGSAYAIKYAGNFKDCMVLDGGNKGTVGCGIADLCLSIANNSASWEACDSYKVEQQFHFLDEAPIKFRLHESITHESVAFHLATRTSVKNFYSFNSKNMMCLNFLADSVQLVSCEDAPYFMTLMNRYDDDEDMARKKENQFVSLVGLMGFTKKINNFIENNVESEVLDPIGEALKTEEEKKLDEASKDDKRAKEGSRTQRKFIDLGSFAGLKGCDNFRTLSRKSGKFVTECPSLDIREDQNRFSENHVFVHSCGGPSITKVADCSGLDPIKNYFDYSEGKDWGIVVKMLPKGEEHNCLQVQGNAIREITNCDKNETDNASIQFRAEPLLSKELKNGKTMMRLRSMTNIGLCADLSNETLVECTKAPAHTFDPVANDFIVKKGNEYKSYFMNRCIVATSHKKNQKYDCQKQLRWDYKLFEKLSIGLSFIPYVGFIPATIFDAFLCGSNEEEFAVMGCVSLGLDLSLGILFGDIMPLMPAGRSAVKFVANKGASLTSKAFAAANAKMALHNAATRTGVSKKTLTGISDTLHKPIADALGKNKLSGKQLLDVFKKVRESSNCFGVSCAGWWSPVPAAGAETNQYLGQLKDYIARSNLTSQEKARAISAINQGSPK